MRTFRVICADALVGLRQLPDASVDCCITSPPYFGLRDYGVAGQIGREATHQEYIGRLVGVFAEVGRVLKASGTLWLNLGDSYVATGGHADLLVNRRRVGTLGIGDRPEHEYRAFRVRPACALKPKDLMMIPARVAIALQDAGWYLRSDIIWHKPNPMPESVTDRPTKAHEYLFLLSRSERYFYDSEAIKETGTYAGPNGQQKSPHAQGFGRRTKDQEADRQDKQRGHGRRHAGFNDRWDAKERSEQCSVMRNKRDVWTIATHPFPDAHFAVMPTALVEPCVLAGCPAAGTVLDPFAGSGTVGVVALRHDRSFIGIELNAEYATMARRRIEQDAPMFNQEAAC